MKLSYTSYSKFCANPEDFRLYKGHGLKPIETKPVLERGSRLHYRAEQYYKQFSNEELEQRCDDEGMSPEGREAGDVLWPSLKNWIDTQPGRIVFAEPNVIVPIGRHELECRIDGIRSVEDGVFRVHEYKTKGPGWGTYDKQLKDIDTEQRGSVQPVCELIAAEHIGCPTRSLDWVVVKEANEKGGIPLIFHVPATRSDYDLEYFKRSFIMVCDTVERWIQDYGLEKPWPHWIHSMWSCDMRGRCNNDWCEFKNICGTEIRVGELPEGFTRRPMEQTLLKPE